MARRASWLAPHRVRGRAYAVLLLAGLGFGAAQSCTPPDRGIVVDGSLGGNAGEGGAVDSVGGDNSSGGGAPGGGAPGGGSGGQSAGGGASGGGPAGGGTGGGGGSGGEPAMCSGSGDCTVAVEPVCDDVAGECRACESDQECEAVDANRPQCASTGACQQCLNGTHCTMAAEPVCDDGTCRGCQEHDECSSLVCRPDGICEDESAIIYARPVSGIIGAGCGSRLQPCLSLETAVGKLSASQPYLAFVPSVDAFETPASTLVLPAGVDVTIVGNSVEVPVDVSPALQLQGGSVNFHGLMLTGPVDDTSDPEQILVNADATELFVRDSAFQGAFYAVQGRDMRLEVSDSEFTAMMNYALLADCSSDCAGVGPTIVHRNRFTAQPGGGVSTTVPGSEVIGNLLVDVAYNGFASAIGVGGAQSVIAHNTLIGSGVCTFPPLVVCFGGTATNDAVVRGNVSFESGIRGSCNANVYSMCPMPEYCVTELPYAGTGNYAGDPSFVDAPGGDYRLAADSPAVDLVPTASGLADDDLDGNARPVGDGFDAGAYERQ